MVSHMANLLLASRGITPLSTVGQNWVTNYINRHNTLKTAYFRKYDKQRAKCENPTIISKWFDRVRAVTAQYNILSEDIFNFDETGYAMGVIVTAKVVTGILTHHTVHIQPGNRKWITAVECISAVGWALPSILIFAGKVHIST
jgi:phage terminase large subunit-like protein